MSEIRGGANFDRALTDVSRRLATPGVLRVGFLSGATYPDGTSVALVAAVQNYGAPSRGIPPRPFFSNMVETKQHEWGPALGALLAKGYSVKVALEMLGQGIEGQLKQSIVDTMDPPLAAATTKSKGFDKPLVNTGHMLASTGYRVEVE